MELPECPVCLQNYDEQEVIPRVLPCGHSACSPCIAQLAASSSRSFPDTIRCPACNQVVPCPHDRGPDALPRNIDLLRFCSGSVSSHTSRAVQSQTPERKRVDFFPIPWDEELLSRWKDRIIPFDAISTEKLEETPAGAVAATFKRASSCGCSEEIQSVHVLPVGSSSSSVSASSGELKLSYTARVVKALRGLSDKVRMQLDFIISTSSRQRSGLCRIFGLWVSPLENSPLFLVSERFQLDLLSVLEKLEDRKTGLISADEVLDFAKLGVELCEAMIGLHSQGTICGSLGPSCFCFDGYGHCLLDLKEVLLVCARVRKGVAESRSSGCLFGLAKCGRYVSPEILRTLHSGKIDSFSGSEVGYGSDVWSLACILVVLLVKGGRLSMKLSRGCVTVDDPIELGSDIDAYNIWKKNVTTKLEASLLGSRLESMLPLLDSCLSYDPASRPSASDIWRCIISLSVKPHGVLPAVSDVPDPNKDLICCLILEDLCQLTKKGNNSLRPENALEKSREILDAHTCLPSENRVTDTDHFQQDKVEWDLVKSCDGGEMKMASLQGHHDCISGFAAGGGFLFSCSFDKTIHVWSLEDFSLVQTLKGHEHRLMGVLFVDAIKPLCITGDSGGCIYAWGIGCSIENEPLRKWYHHNDWRYSGVHSLAVSGSQYLYSGSGDKSIKAWSLQDFHLICTMTGHKSAVSSLAVSNGILFSGSWDGTVRLWWLHDHSPLAVLEDGEMSSGTSVLSLSVYDDLLVASHDNGSLKMWRNGVLTWSDQVQNGAVFAVEMHDKWLFSGGWDKIIQVQELTVDDSKAEVRPIGSISCDSVITALLYYQGKLFAGCNKDLKKAQSMHH